MSNDKTEATGYIPDAAFPEAEYGTVELVSGPQHRAATDISPKVTFAALGAAVATVLIYGIEALSSADIPTVVEGSITVIITFGLGWLVPDNR